MIITLKRDSATQVCAGCQMANKVPLDVLVAGQEDADPGSIRLPACPRCGSVETLFRNTPASSAFGALVNRLHARLKAAGQVCDGFPAEDRDSPDMAPDEDLIEVDGKRLRVNGGGSTYGARLRAGGETT